MSDAVQMVPIAERLEELERQTKRLRKDNRELKIVFIIVAVALLVGEVVEVADFFFDKRLGIFTDGLVQTPRLVIVDDAGDRRAELGTSAAGVPHLTLFDTSGRPRFVATQFDDRVRLRLADQDKRSIELQLVDGGEQSLFFTGKDGSTRVALGYRDGDAGLHLLGPAGQRRVVLSACEAGDSGLLLFDQAEMVRLLAGVGDDGNSLLNVFDEAGQARIKLGQSPEGWPALDMLASDGTLRATLHTPNDWSCLTLHGPRGYAMAKTCVDYVGLARTAFYNPDGDLTWSTPPEWYALMLDRVLRQSGDAVEGGKPSQNDTQER